jgi:phosphatidylserine decarboxylase
MPDSHPIIAREGWPHVLVTLGVAILATYFFGWWSILFWIALVFVLQFFRDPSRSIIDSHTNVISAADGRVIVVGRMRDPYLDRDALKISVFMNVFNVHSNRAPVTGTVVKTWYNAGHFVNAALDKASAENERMALHIRTDDGTDVTCVQIAGLIARRILCYVGEGDHVTAGQRYGFIRFGSRVDLYLPITASARVSVGDKTTAGHSIVAEFAPGA